MRPVSGDPLLQLEKEDRIASPPDLKMDPKKMSMRELLECCLNTKEEAAQTEFVARITPTIQGVAYNMVRSWRFPGSGLIQDLTNSTFVKLLPALPNLEWRNEGQFFGWVRKITLSAVGDWMRKQKPEDPADNLDMVEDNRSTGQQIVCGIQCSEIEKFLRKTGATEKEIDMLWLFFVYDYSAREISEMPTINLSENRVETILARLVRYVRRGMDGPSSSE